MSIQTIRVDCKNSLEFWLELDVRIGVHDNKPTLTVVAKRGRMPFDSRTLDIMDQKEIMANFADPNKNFSVKIQQHEDDTDHE